MQEYFTSLLDQSSFPLWSAFLLGLITSLGPCTLTTNIAAIGFVSKEASNKKRVLLGGLLYAVGRAFTYIVIALLLFVGADALNISKPFARYGEKLIGPLLLIIGLAMLNIIPIRFPSFNGLSEKIEKQKRDLLIQHFLLGVVFALAFCSYSGVMYFGLLIPMTLSAPSGLLLPLFFALGTSVIVLAFTILIAFAFSGINQWFIRIKNVEFWLRRLVAAMFITIGVWKIFELILS
ncbi:aromatic aminobenezylarsenical efflux permease ArsG family transporter [Sunxiuqinia indica]|uniref:aromatic aminobenezylarsenical efflux permease ArsG family transporter n=1 Tax=Sunxiuqinia indica TaxID=2692584 RepID=UPI00135A70FC|nr:aromatic aminobenezylarsenical efflux permease ArsG family transporter [Sunxiuqinia indica]